MLRVHNLQHGVFDTFSQMFEEVFRDKRAQMEGRLRGENPERAKYGVIDEKLQRVERQLKVTLASPLSTIK